MQIGERWKNDRRKALCVDIPGITSTITNMVRAEEIASCWLDQCSAEILLDFHKIEVVGSLAMLQHGNKIGEIVIIEQADELGYFQIRFLFTTSALKIKILIEKERI